MSIPLGFYQGNRSEYLAIPALSKLGFVIPIPRQEDQFGVDFIVHLTRLEANEFVPLGKCFGIQIKSSTEPLILDTQEKRKCLWDSSIPFFLGVISRTNLTLTIYNTLGRFCFFWMKGNTVPFHIVPKETGDGLEKPDYKGGKVWTGKPIMKISINEPSTTEERKTEFKTLQQVMTSWVYLENQMISLKEQDVPVVWRPMTYTTSNPLTMDSDQFERVAYFNPSSLPKICIASETVLDSLSCYLKDCLKRDPKPFRKEIMQLISEQLEAVKNVRKKNDDILNGLTK